MRDAAKILSQTPHSKNFANQDAGWRNSCAKKGGSMIESNRVPVYQILRDAEEERRRRFIRRQQASGWAWALFFALELALVVGLIYYF